MKQTNNPLSSPSIFFSIATFFSLHSSLNASINLIPHTCKQISHSDSNVEYHFCVTALGSDPRSANATSITQLGSMSFQISISKTISISSKIGNIFEDQKFDPNARDALKACYEEYFDAQHGLREGLMGLKSGDYSTANNRANIALIAPAACESGFEVSPLTKENSDFFQLAAISLGFIDLLHKPS